MSAVGKCVITYPSPVADDVNEETFSVIETADLQDKTPVIILLGWAGCLDKHLSKYSSIYERKRYITVRYICPTSVLFFNPGKLVNIAKALLEKLYDNKLNDHPIFFHIFSNGGSFVYCNITRLLHSSEKYKKFIDVKGCIFDSTPGKRRFLKGAKALMASLRVNIVLKYIAGFTFIVFAIVNYIIALIFQNRNKPAFFLFEGVAHDEGRWPEMFLYSKADDTIGYADIEEVVDYRRKLGINVFNTCWDDSPHVAHFVHHREEYIRKCHEFVNFCLKKIL